MNPTSPALLLCLACTVVAVAGAVGLAEFFIHARLERQDRDAPASPLRPTGPRSLR